MLLAAPPPEAYKRTALEEKNLSVRFVRDLEKGPRTSEPDAPVRSSGGQAGGPVSASARSATREPPPTRPGGLVHQADAAVLAEPPQGAADGGLGRADFGGERHRTEETSDGDSWSPSLPRHREPRNRPYSRADFDEW